MAHDKLSDELLEQVRELTQAQVQESLQEKLFQVGTKDLFDTIMWIANDLQVWQSADVNEDIRLHSAMLREALVYQIDKANIRINREEES